MSFALHKIPALRRLSGWGCAALLMYGGAAQAAKPPVPDRPDTKLAAALAPHKAVYDIELSARHSGTPVLNIKGRLLFETQTGCDAWTTNHNFKLYYEYADNAPLMVTSDFSTYESFDGKSFHFSSRRHRNGALYEELRGAATRDAGGGITAQYSLPPDLSYRLGPRGAFPMGHTLMVLQGIRDKKRFFSAEIFDGSDSEGPVEISSFIGAPLPASAPAGEMPGVDAALLAAPAHRIRMAFFPMKDDKAEADYEMDLVFHENGVISDMTVDYKDFSVTQRLVRLEKLSPVECGASKPKSRAPAGKKAN